MITVLSSTYNHTVGQLSMFIGSMANQTLKDLEVWILQDGPDEDKTAKKVVDFIGDPRIKYEESEVRHNTWGYTNRNKKLFEINSEWVAFQSCDNYVVPTAYQWMVMAAEKTKMDVIICDILHNYPGVTSLERLPYTLLPTEFRLNRIDLTNFIVRTKLVKEVGGFQEKINADGLLADTLTSRFGKDLKIAKLPMCLVCHN